MTKLKNKDFTLGFSVKVEREHGHEMTTVSIFSGQVMTLKKRLDGAIDNKDGYGSLEAAGRIEHETREALDNGFTEWFDRDFISDHVGVVVKYQRFDPISFCRPGIDVGREMSTILYGADLVAKLAKGLPDFPKSPEELVKKLSRFVECERWGHEYLVKNVEI